MCVRMYMCTCHYVAYMPQVSYIFAIVATLASLLVISYNFHRHIYDEPMSRLSCLSFVTCAPYSDVVCKQLYLAEPAGSVHQR